MELIIKAIKADGSIVELYNGELSLKAIGMDLLNPLRFNEVQSALSGAKLEYSYNSETSSTKTKEIAQYFESLRMLLGFVNTQGVINDSLDKAGITRTTDLRAKILECAPSAVPTTIDLVESKVNKIYELMAEINEIFKNHKPLGLETNEQYYIRHHFASPKSIAKSKTTN